MNDKILGHLREALVCCKDEQSDKFGSRELSLVMTKIEEAILWRQEDLRRRTPEKNEANS